MKAKIILGIFFGDESKGKCTYDLLNTKTLFGNNYYTHCMRFNGSSNAGHTIYHNGKKFITHQLPAGIFHGVLSIIGHGCVVNPEKFLEEIDYLESNGIRCRDIVKIAYNAHIVTKEHIEEDSKDTLIGTTKNGVGPAYRDKYARIGVRAENIEKLKPYLIDVYDEFFNKNKNATILCEGAQGFYLDVDFCHSYPYTSSSHCTTGSAIMAGIPYWAVEDVYGVCKCYTTYVGNMKFQPEGEIYEKIQEVGNEFGATTGRKRQVNLLNINMLKKAIDINGVTCLIVNKMDILRKVNYWKVIKDNNEIDLKTEKNFKKFIKKEVFHDVIFSDRPDRI
jgi:adenylosuccinate synthase